MGTSERIQLRRTAGWRKPPDTIVVARPSKWGNPHIVVGDDRATAVESFARDLEAGALSITVADVQRELAGFNLACWCNPSEPCHTDVLLRVANWMSAEPKEDQ